MLKKKVLLLFICMVTTNLLFAQENLSEDRPFFDKKMALYERWIASKGMGDVIKVDEYQLKRNGMELELFLSLRTTDPDTAAALWKGLEYNFEQQNPGETLNATLFHTFVRMMEIPPEQGNVQVYFPRADGLGYNPCFYVWAWEEGGRVVEEGRVNNCKAQSFDVEVELPIIIKKYENAEIRIQHKKSSKEVFNEILTYAEGRYEKKQNCKQRYPKVETTQIDNHQLKFVVEDLCREVLWDEDDPICTLMKELFDWECNHKKRERLEFRFNFHPTSKGYVLKGEITGKFGSGVFRPRGDGYMDMDPDFEDSHLKPYTCEFKKALKAYLQ